MLRNLLIDWESSFLPQKAKLKPVTKKLIEINFLKIFLHIAYFFLVTLRNFFVFLTRLYPFSKLINEEFLFHYKKKPVNKVIDEMSKILFKTGLSFSNFDNGADENFVYLEGKFERYWKGENTAAAIDLLKERFGNYLYINKLENGNYKIMVSRKVV